MALPDVTGSTLYGIYDLFSSAGRDWALLMGKPVDQPAVAAEIVAADTEPFAAANGLVVHPAVALGDCQAPDVVCLPDIYVAPGEKLGSRYQREGRWVREQYEKGSIIATACSGALLLAEQGLLDGLDATTHWAYCDALKRDYPTIRLHPNQPLVATGDGHRIIMAGGGTSWQDLVLYLIARLVGVEEAMQIARIYLINWHDVGQQPFASLAAPARSDDGVIAKCLEWVAEHYQASAPVAAMVRMSGLPERSFARRCKKATGLTPLEYVHALRLEEAKRLLECTGFPIEEVAENVGYEDASFFGRLFRRQVKLTPAQYRKRFGSLRQRLEQEAIGV